MLKDPVLEARARADFGATCAARSVRARTIDDSNAPISRDLRLAVRERLVAGDSDAQVVDYIVARYGEFVLFTAARRGVEPDPVAGGACDAAGGRRRLPLR